MENKLNAHAFASPYYRGLVDADKDHDGVELNSTQFSRMQHEPARFSSRIDWYMKSFVYSSASAEEVNPEETANDSSRYTYRFPFPNHIQELETGNGHGSGDAFEAFIDIWDEDEFIFDDATARRLTYQAWKDHIDELKRSGLDDSSMKMMSETAAALGGQAIGVVVANAIANGPTASTSSWAVYYVEIVILLGLCCTVAGIGLRRKRRAMSVLMNKVGVMATISAIIIPLASHLPPAMMWTVGPLAFLVSAFAVALA